MYSRRNAARLRFLSPLLLVAGCATAGPAPDHATPGSWTYSGERGPERWGALSPDFAVCESGTMQSPINLANATRTDLPDVRFNYRPTPLDIENKGHTVQVEYQPGSTMTVGGTAYELVQFHFHTPGEHHLQGKEFPAELHLVHRGPDGGLAVLGVFIQSGSANMALAPVWSHLPRRPGEERQVNSASINAESLLPADRQHYRYPGSLTTPPCSEGVQWFVLQQPIQMSAEQIAALRTIIGTSNRPVQPLGTRQLRFGM